MDDQLFSLRCPHCRQSLLEALLFRLAFIRMSNCPFCGSLVKWSKRPLIMTVLGLLTVGAVIFCIAHGFLSFKGQSGQILAAVSALGTGLFLLGLVFSRFERVDPSELVPDHSRPYSNI